MQQYTNEIDLGEEKTDKLVEVLGMVEEADTKKDAVWLPEEDCETVGEIRAEIEAQTGR